MYHTDFVYMHSDILQYDLVESDNEEQETCHHSNTQDPTTIWDCGSMCSYYQMFIFLIVFLVVIFDYVGLAYGQKIPIYIALSLSGLLYMQQIPFSLLLLCISCIILLGSFVGVHVPMIFTKHT